MDQPGENHFAEALAKALGPTTKDPTARTQIVSLASRLEPEAASTGFSSSNSTGPTALLLFQMMSQNSMQMQQSAVGGLGTQNSSSAVGTFPHFGNIFLLCHPILVRRQPVVALKTSPPPPTTPRPWQLFQRMAF
jgi:hypothetical protein